MSITTAFSNKKEISDAVTDLHYVFKSDNKFILYFASSHYNPDELSASIQQKAGNVTAIGCTTAGEIISGKMTKDSIVAMGLGNDIIEDLYFQIVPNIHSGADIKPAFKTFENHFGKKLSEMDLGKYVGLIIADGLQGAEENLMEKIGDLTDITFIGGSAGDDLAFKKTFIFADGKTYTNAAILILLKLKKNFDIIKTQSFKRLNKVLKATKVDESRRMVIEFNGKSAVVAYAEALGIDPSKLADYFGSHPIGLITADGQPYVRSPQQIVDSSIIFYCKIKQDMELEVLESTDIVKDTNSAIKEKENALGKISGMINFHCILRTLELEKKNQTGQYGQVFSSIPTIGFSTYGEEYIGHINQTSTILLFK